MTTNDAADVNVTPGQTGAILVYKVTNSGNATQGVTFTTVQEANWYRPQRPFAGGTGPKLRSDRRPDVRVEEQHRDLCAGQRHGDRRSRSSLLARSNFVFIVTNIPASQVDADVAVEALVAQVAAAGGSATYGTAPGANITTDDSGNAWTPGTVQNIFADAAGTDDVRSMTASHSSRDAYLVKSAKLTITKTSTVVSDADWRCDPARHPGCRDASTRSPSPTRARLLPPASRWRTASRRQITAGNLAYNANTITIADPNVSAGATQACLDARFDFRIRHLQLHGRVPTRSTP